MATRPRLFVRSQVVGRVQRRLERESCPRLQMTLIAALTGASGLLASFLLLHQGVESMALRYPLALALAYGMFLFLIWLWLRTNAEDYAELPDLPHMNLPGDSGAELLRSGGGGDFGGGGASASFDAPASGASDSASGLGDSVGSLADADEAAIPLLAVALALGLALASFYVIYIAPALLAEVLVDGALSYALSRHLRGEDPSHWLATAVRRTALPFLATAVFLAIMGAAMAAWTPGSHSIGDVVRLAALR